MVFTLITPFPYLSENEDSLSQQLEA